MADDCHRTQAVIGALLRTAPAAIPFAIAVIAFSFYINVFYTMAMIGCVVAHFSVRGFMARFGREKVGAQLGRSRKVRRPRG